jgi:hypothetical protein
MLCKRSLSMDTSGNRTRGMVRGLTLPNLLQGMEGLPSRSWLADDLTVVQGAAPLHFGVTPPRWLVRIDGPIESRDGRSIRAAVARGDDPLDHELRADLSVAAAPGGIAFSARDEDLVLEMAATLLQQHAADAMRRRLVDVPRPELGAVAAIIGPNGLAVRGVETQVYPGFLDIGVSEPDLEATPAMRSLVLDRVTGGWHTD